MPIILGVAGCPLGPAAAIAPPTARQSHITSLDKFAGTPNLEVAGLPVQGRSGGGVFTSDGRVIGVCNAAVPGDNEGLYAAVAAIQSELDYTDLAYVYRNPNWNAEPDRSRQLAGNSPSAAATATAPAGRMVSVDPVDPPTMPKRMPPPSDLLAPTGVTTPAASRSAISSEERTALEEIERRRSDDAEVICVIRSRSNPKAPSEIIVIDKASPALLEAIGGKRG